MRLQNWLGVLMGFLVLGGLTTARAADYEDALNSAPQGITVANIFTPGTTANNKSQVVDTTNPQAPGTQAVMITNAKNQFGSIWSTDENAFDLNQDETISMWMYFGAYDKKAIPDGMAFVLQNDDHGLAATPTFGKSISGETLGAWAVDNDSSRSVTSELAATAIQKSWALEFDNRLNTSDSYSNAGDANSFDLAFDGGTTVTGPHLAVNYPGEASTYHYLSKKSGIVFPKTGWYAALNHQGVIQGNDTFLTNGQWHHVTLHWTAATHTMSYNFDDKDPATGQSQTGTTRQVNVDPTIIDPDNTGKVRWGFTSATGSVAANNLVVFEGVPGLVEASAKTKLTDLTTDKTVNEGDTLRGTDKVQLDYTLTYQGGKQDWQDVTAKLNLPDQLTFDQGQVTYANGKTEDVAASDISDQQLTHQLGQALSKDNPTATIRLTGKVEDVKQAMDVDKTTSRFTAVNGVLTAETPAFKLNPRLEIGLFAVGGTSFTLEAGQTQQLRAQVYSPDGKTLTNADFTVIPTINGKDYPTYPLEDPDDEASGKVLYTPDAKDLKTGNNEVTLAVRDVYGNESDPVTYKLMVTGGLAFETVAPNSSFKTTELTGANQSVKRTNDWDVKIVDSRQAGSKWQLQVSADPFTDDNGKLLAGKLVYRDGQERTPVTTTPMAIQDGEATDDRDVTDVVADWNDTTGLELDVGSAALSGDYKTNITWTLTDAPS